MHWNVSLARELPYLRVRLARVLRITEHGQKGEMSLELEGRLVGPWVEQLRETCRQSMETSKTVSLDLRSVSFADEHGVALLQELVAKVQLLNCSLFLAQQLQIETAEDSWQR